MLMAEPLRLTVLTPAKTLLNVEGAAWVQARLADGGGIGIYPGHAPLLAETVTAPLRYADPSGEHTLDLEAGILQVERGGVTVFTSGPAQPREGVQTDGSPEASQGSQGSEDARFDRLAQALLATVQAQPKGVLGAGDEEA
jgi:F0F1-type ATP synthase epsilon subunit